MDSRLTNLLRAGLFVVAAVLVPKFCSAQATPAGTSAPTPSSTDFFGTYSYLHPFESHLYGQPYTSIPGGFSAGFTSYFLPWLGIDAEYAKLPNSPDYCFSTMQAGLGFRASHGRIVPFAHTIAGAARTGPAYDHSGSSNACNWGWAANGGVGIDYILPAFHNHLALRLPELDFQYTHTDFGQQNPAGSNTGGVGEIKAVRAEAGIVYRVGEAVPPYPASYGCEVHPVQVYPGDPITVTGKVMNLEESKKLLPTYTWNATGGRMPAQTTTPNNTIATSGAAPGDYTVGGTVSEGGAPNQHATCNASFRVVGYDPPTVACSASPTSIAPGGYATVVATGRSPQNRPLNYSFGTTAGQITVNGPTTATLATSGVAPGPVNVTCNVVDDQGNSVHASAQVSIVAPPAPPPPPAPAAEKLCSVSFERDKKRPVRVDNEAKGCLDDIALALGRDPNALLVVVGKHGADEKPDAAAERTLNVKQYLTAEKGVDPSRIEVRTGETKDRTADTVLVPPGATWDTEGTESFDPARIQRHGQAYAPAPKTVPKTR